MNNIIYILINEAMPGYVKIGKTNNLGQRMRSLYRTQVPLPFECHYACEVENGQETEAWLFGIFARWRVSVNREFFWIDPEGAVEALKVKAIREVTPKQIYIKSKGDKKALKRAKNRRNRFNFEIVDIPLGAEIYFSRNKNIKAKIVDLHSVQSIEFEGKITNLSEAARKILSYDYKVAGTLYWKYKGETLDERRRKMESEE